jgi:hypothetical protein
MPPDWRLFHVRRSTRKRLFFEVPLKTSFSGTFHALRFEKYANRYLGAFCYRFNRRFHLEEMTGRILRATCNCNARPERILRSAELAT